MRHLRLPLLLLLLALFGLGQAVEQSHWHEAGEQTCSICHFSPALASAPAVLPSLQPPAAPRHRFHESSAVGAALALAFHSRAPPAFHA